MEFPYSGADAITLNDMRDQITEVYDHDEFDLYFDNNFCLTDKKKEFIKKFFKDKGYNVTDKAIKHQYQSWCADLKSGYRDEENGYHLFSPCGCNPFRLSLSSLSPRCKHWQETYEC